MTTITVSPKIVGKIGGKMMTFTVRFLETDTAPIGREIELFDLTTRFVSGIFVRSVIAIEVSKTSAVWGTFFAAKAKKRGVVV